MLAQVKSGFSMGGRSTPIPAEYFGSGASNESANVSMPGSIASGDLGVLFDFAANSDSTVPTSVYPSGWTAIGASENSTFATYGFRQNMSYKVLDGTETTLTGMVGGLASNKLVLVFRKLVPALTWGTPAGVVAGVSFLGPTHPQTITVGTAPLIVIGMVMNNNNLVMTPAQTATISGGVGAFTRARAGYIIYGAGAVNNDVDIDTGDGYIGIGGYYIPLT